MITIKEIENRLLKAKKDSRLASVPHRLTQQKRELEAGLAAELLMHEKYGKLPAGTAENYIKSIKALPPEVKELTPQEKLAARLLYILSNPELFMPYLIELNNKLSSLNVKQAAPSEYCQVHGAQFPYPPLLPNINTPKWVSALENILLTQEKLHNVNQDRSIDIPVFMGDVPSVKGDKRVSNGLLWNDSSSGLATFFHGIYAHRIQHYILTRALEDKIIQLDDLGPTIKQPLFCNLVSPATDSLFFKVFEDCGIYKRSLWAMTLDNDRVAPHKDFIKESPLSGPVQMMEYLLSPSSFNNLPFLSQTLYEANNTALYEIGLKLNKSLRNTFNTYCKLYDAHNNGEQAFDAAMDMHDWPAIKTLWAPPENNPEVIHWQNVQPGAGAIRFSSPQIPILNALLPYRTKKYLTSFFTAFDEGHYGRALRFLAANAQEIPNSLELGDILLRHKAELALDINQISAINKNAYMHAKEKGNSDFCLLLWKHGATVDELPCVNNSNKQNLTI